MSTKLKLALLLPAKPEKVYAAYLDSKLHSKMTGSPAHIQSVAGTHFDAWAGYISGTNLELVPGDYVAVMGGR